MGTSASRAITPLFLFNQFGDLERCLLRLGHVHSAESWRDVLESVLARYRGRGLTLYFRGDAAFAQALGFGDHIPEKGLWQAVSDQGRPADQLRRADDVQGLIRPRLRLSVSAPRTPLFILFIAAP